MGRGEQGTTAWILGDQLSHSNPALKGADRVLIVESEAKLRSLPFHRQKLHLVLSAMRQQFGGHNELPAGSSLEAGGEKADKMEPDTAGDIDPAGQIKS